MPARAMGIGSGRPPAEAASMFKDLLVPVVLGEVSTEAFEVACTLAAHDGGRVTGLVALSAVTPVVGAMNYFPEAVYDSLREAVLEASDSCPGLRACGAPLAVSTSGASACGGVGSASCRDRGWAMGYVL